MMTLLQVVNLLGVSVFAVSGVLAAGRKSLDLLGVMVIAMVTAIGGGTIRDLLLDRQIFWIRETSYLWVIVAASLLTLLYVRYREPPDDALLIADALGLALFTIGGAQIAEGVGLTGVVVVIMGVLTGVAGGVVRDVLTAEIPLVLRRGHLYATAAISGATLYLLLSALGAPRPLPGFAGMVAIVLLRLGSIVWGLELPVLALPAERTRPVAWRRLRRQRKLRGR